MRDEAAFSYRDDLRGADPVASPVGTGGDLPDLARSLDGLGTSEMLETAIHALFPGRICAVSSFGADSAVALALIAEVAPATPILFLDTGKHFAETLAYRDRLVARLGLSDVRSIAPDRDMLDAVDPNGDLWRTRPDDCCLVRKVLPLDAALDDRLAGFGAWINGRKRYQGGGRARLPRIERVDGRIKLNPLADWSAEMVRDAFLARGLPRHPLVAKGYPSIGCAPCTRPAGAGADPRAGRWLGSGKTECGIHR